MKQAANYAIRKLLEFLTRPRSPPLHVMRAGFGLAVLGLASGWVLRIVVPTTRGNVDLSVSNASGAEVFLHWVGVFGLIIFTLGVAWAALDQLLEHRRVSRKRVLVIEVRGLRDTSDTPLAAAVPTALEGQRDPLLIDLRQPRDGKLLDPEAAVANLISLPREVQRRRDGHGRDNLSLVYGGLAPVPLNFLSGVLLDDEQAMVVMDWDRHREVWRSLDGTDDGNRFDLRGIEQIPVGAPDVVLAVSVSYEVDRPAIAATFPHLPLVELCLAQGGTDAHWSAEKQRALARQFLDTVIALSNRHVRVIHLVLAAQSSVVVQFGRRYDKRNLPTLIVYQYERGQRPAYPWGVQVPVAGSAEARIIWHGQHL